MDIALLIILLVAWIVFVIKTAIDGTMLENLFAIIVSFIGVILYSITVIKLLKAIEGNNSNKDK